MPALTSDQIVELQIDLQTIQTANTALQNIIISAQPTLAMLNAQSANLKRIYSETDPICDLSASVQSFYNIGFLVVGAANSMASAVQDVLDLANSMMTTTTPSPS